jgi:hypothetical protein
MIFVNILWLIVASMLVAAIVLFERGVAAVSFSYFPSSLWNCTVPLTEHVTPQRYSVMAVPCLLTQGLGWWLMRPLVFSPHASAPQIAYPTISSVESKAPTSAGVPVVITTALYRRCTFVMAKDDAAAVCDSLESLAFPETPAGLWAASFDWAPTQAGVSAT